jgi:hypothetical protein
VWRDSDFDKRITGGAPIPTCAALTAKTQDLAI